MHRVPSRMFPKVTSLPLGVPRPGMVGVLRGFDPDVVHLASPALLGYGGLQAARYLGVPTIAVFQTDIAGFATSYGMGIASRAAWAWTRHLHKRADRTLAPSTAAMEDLAAHGIPRVHKWSRGVDVTGFAPSARDLRLRRVWSVDGKPIVGFVGRLAPEKHVERLAGLAARTDLQVVVVGDGIDRRKLENADADSGFHRGPVRRRAGCRVCLPGRLRAPRRARDVLSGGAGGDGVGRSGHHTRRGRTTRSGRALTAPDCCCPSTSSNVGCRSRWTIWWPNGAATRPRPGAACSAGPGR